MGDAVQSHHIQQLVAVEQPARRIDQLQAVGIAVQRDAVVSTLFAHRCHQRLRRRGAHTVVDVQPVGLAANGVNLGAQLVEDVRRYVVCSPCAASITSFRPLSDKSFEKLALQNSM